MARYTERKRGRASRSETIARRCARHAKNGAANVTQSGHARAAR